MLLYEKCACNCHGFFSFSTCVEKSAGGHREALFGKRLWFRHDKA